MGTLDLVAAVVVVVPLRRRASSHTRPWRLTDVTKLKRRDLAPSSSVRPSVRPSPTPDGIVDGWMRFSGAVAHSVGGGGGGGELMSRASRWQRKRGWNKRRRGGGRSSGANLSFLPERQRPRRLPVRRLRHTYAPQFVVRVHARTAAVTGVAPANCRSDKSTNGLADGRTDSEEDTKAASFVYSRRREERPNEFGSWTPSLLFTTIE